MAEEAAKNTQYQYTGNSNLVLQSKRTGTRNDPKGDPETLFGKIDPKEFGARAQRERVSAKDKSRQVSDKTSNQKRKKKKEEAALTRAYGLNSVIAATDDMEGIKYQPKTKETQVIYEMMLGIIQKLLGDHPPEIVRSCTDHILTFLKSDELKDLDKMNEIRDILRSIKQEQFDQLINLSKKLNDYVADDQEGDGNDDAIDGEIGVAVEFEEDDEEEEEGFDKDESDDEDMDGDYVAPDQDKGVDSNDNQIVLINEEEIIETRREAKNSKILLLPYDIDAFWLQREFGKYYGDEQIVQEKSAEAMALLSSNISVRQCEDELNLLTDYNQHELIGNLMENRDIIVWCTKLERAGQDNEARQGIENQMRALSLDHILKSLRTERSKPSGANFESGDKNDVNPQVITNESKLKPKQIIELDLLAFSQGNHLNSNKKVKLPEGSFKRSLKGYDEYHVPAPKVKPLETNEKLIPISKLPEWTKLAFKGASSLNRIQSRVFPCAFEKDENMLLCAPTGAGKTNCAMLAILRAISKHYDPETDTVDLDKFKIVYIAPMKALVQEMVQNFGERLKYLGVQVAELTGDAQLTKAQISETQIIVTTPEKWDVITRKATDRSYTNLVQLIIIDEIHLLHDDRGPVLESLVVRTLRNIEETQEPVRLVGLSATLPNYIDVANFLRVKEASGLFFFDGSFRPCPLKQQFVAITEKKALKRFQTMNEVAYAKILEQANKNQVLIFVHSRKETARTAHALRDMAIDAKTISEFLTQDGDKEVLAAEAESATDADLKDLLPYGFAIHHAGMSRPDRTQVEESFKQGHIKVLVSTATLAWGVNLPAHTVIIKGTQIYSPEKGRWVELSPQDVLQMLGRAGRPQYDTFGEGIIITTHNEIQYYLSLLNQQLPIESQFISKLADNLNAEIVLGTVRNRDDAVNWLGYTYLYVRMLRNGPLYGVGLEEFKDDPRLSQKRVDLIHAAATLLESCQLLKYDRRSGKFQGTELGRIASHYYISHRSMATYNQHLKPSMNYIELLRAFAMSDEFRLIPVREEEKMEVATLLERVPIPIKENSDEPAAKISVLLQAYISQLSLNGFALMADMVYITQSAGRILRSIFEMCLRRGWSHLSRLALNLCKIVDRRCWLSMTPLRQFKSIPSEVIRKIERKDFPWERYFDLDAAQIGELVGVRKAGPLLHKYVGQFPRLEIKSYIQPLTRSLLLFEVTIEPRFEWDAKVHGSSEAFWVIVEDSDGENILYHETFILKQRYAQEEHYISFTVPLHEPMPPNYFVSVISDRWLHSEARESVSFRSLILPDKYPPSTELYDMQLLPFDVLNPKHQPLFKNTAPYFNPIQTQSYNALYSTDDNVFLAAPSGSGKTICAEFAILRQWSKEKKGGPRQRCLVISSNQESVDELFNHWNERFGSIGKEVVSLSGETTADLKKLERGDLVLATPSQWDVISRGWRKRENVRTIGLIVMDDLHMVGSGNGPTYEVVVSRARLITSQTKYPTRFVALSAPLANANEVASWIGVQPNAIFNFHPADRPVPLEVHIQSFAIPHFPSRMLAMAKPTYLAIKNYASEDTTIVYVPSRRQCRLTAVELSTLQAASATPSAFLGCSKEQIEAAASQVEDWALAKLLPSGIGFYHEALSPRDVGIVRRLFEAKAIRVLVASRDSCWSMGNMFCQLVVVMGAQFFEGKEHRYVDFPVTDLLKMMGRASKPMEGAPGRCVLMCQPNKKEYYKKFLNEGLPIESHLNHTLHDHFNAEIVTQSINNQQDAVDFLTWTFFYRRLIRNPNYYSLQGTSPQHISDYLTELVESTMLRLEETQCITIEDEIKLSPLNLGMIAAYYNIKYDTLDIMERSLTDKTKLRGLLEIVAAANEFSDLPIRHHEESVLSKLYTQMPAKLPLPNMRDPATKAHLLLQAHFSRTQLPPDMTSDLNLILRRVIPLLQAIADVTASKGWLSPALAAMELAQMCVQAMWDRDSTLKQLPHFDNERIQLATKMGIDSLDQLDLSEEDVREELLKGLTPNQVRQVAEVFYKYPSVSVDYQILTPADEIRANSRIEMQVQLRRNLDEEDSEIDTSVFAPFFPTAKDESWWVVVGDQKTNQLFSIRRFTLHKELTLKVKLDVPNQLGHQNWVVYLMSDSYLGTDQEFDLDVNIEKEESDDEDEE